MGTYFSFSYMLSTFPILFAYSYVSVAIMLASCVLGTIIGCFGAFCRINSVFGLQQLVIAYVSFIRGTPLLVLLFLIYFTLPEILVRIGFVNARAAPPLLYVIIVYSLSFGGYATETMRSAIAAVPAGQLEAAYSVGMSTFQAYAGVLLPQAFRLAVPPLCNNAISTLKGTALAFNVGVIDMMSKASMLGPNSHRFIELYLNIAVIYGLLVFVLTQVAGRLEKKLGGGAA